MSKAALRFKDIGSVGFNDLHKKRPDLFLLDVREPFELIAFGAIPGVTNIPLQTLVSRLGELPADRSHPIVAICQSGHRSREVAHYLSSIGFTTVYNLLGGTPAWRATGQSASLRLR